MAEKDATARLRRAVQENNLFLVKRLIQRTDMRNPDPGPKRYTSLAWAAVLGHEETFEYLLNVGHDDEELSKDVDDNTVLLLLADLKPPLLDPYGLSDPDFLAAALRMARLYYDRYPFILDWSNTSGKTALHTAALKGNEELVRMLCDLGADTDLTDDEGNTPLHYASAWGNIPIVQLLIERGCQYAARNNEGFTPSDYAYSFSTRDTLQDTARAQFELNKKARRVFAQAATRGSEWGGTPPIPKSLDVNARMRRGSNTSGTSDSETEGHPSGQSVNGIHKHQLRSSSSVYPHTATSSSSVFSTPSPSHFASHMGTALHPPSTNPASALTPIATRTLQQDANAMEKYMRRNRSGSASTDIKSQNSSNPSSAGPSANGDDIASLPLSGSVAPRRRLRPSVSAAQLRSNPNPPFLISNPTSQDVARHRAGTNPASVRANPPTFSPPSDTLPLPSATPGRTTSRGPISSPMPFTEEPRIFTGPPSEYAKFPEPPGGWDSPASTDTLSSANHTPTATRRLPFHILSKPLPSIDHSMAGHRRGSSSHSLR
ncbi:ankyrin repeat-containing domain protein [Amylostereum chailletii]|nr:ankyrin repeat-containing domain protein [Amylostereum chailletii]